LGKFDATIDEGIFLGYSTRSKAYRCFNKKMRKNVESTNVKVVETMKDSIDFDVYVSDESNYVRIEEIVEEQEKDVQEK
jgi:hypothetical protein